MQMKIEDTPTGLLVDEPGELDGENETMNCGRVGSI